MSTQNEDIARAEVRAAVEEALDLASVDVRSVETRPESRTIEVVLRIEVSWDADMFVAEPLDAPFSAGAEAQSAGGSVRDCRLPEGSAERAAWRRGFDSGAEHTLFWSRGRIGPQCTATTLGMKKGYQAFKLGQAFESGGDGDTAEGRGWRKGWRAGEWEAVRDAEAEAAP